MKNLYRDNLMRVTIVNGEKELTDVKGYFLSCDTFIAFAENEKDFFHRYFVPDELQSYECEVRHIPYVKKWEQCTGFDRSFDGLKKQIREYEKNGIILNNNTLGKLISLPIEDEIIEATYTLYSAIVLDQDFYDMVHAAKLHHGEQGMSELFDHCVSRSFSIMRYSENGKKFIPLEENDEAVYVSHQSYDKEVPETVYPSLSKNIDWSRLSDYDINYILGLYSNHMNIEKETRNKEKIR